MEPTIVINAVFSDEIRAKIRDAAYTLPPIRNALALPAQGDTVKFAGLESFTFAVLGRYWTFSANGTAQIDLVLEHLPGADSPERPPLSLVPPPTTSRPDA